MNTLSLLEQWYGLQCNGQWEHERGIQIGTLDNPGWEVKIDLTDTPMQDLPFEEFRRDNGERDWMFCGKEELTFVGRGDPGKLELILQYFLAEHIATKTGTADKEAADKCKRQ